MTWFRTGLNWSPGFKVTSSPQRFCLILCVIILFGNLGFAQSTPTPTPSPLPYECLGSCPQEECIRFAPPDNGIGNCLILLEPCVRCSCTITGPDRLICEPVSIMRYVDGAEECLLVSLDTFSCRLLPSLSPSPSPSPSSSPSPSPEPPSYLIKLAASDEAAGEFGYSVAVSGATMVVGTRTLNGSAYIFDTNTWGQLLKLTAFDGATEDYFGISVAASDTAVVVGAYYDNDRGSESGAAYIFDKSTGAQLFKLTASDGAKSDWFGFSVAVSDTMAVTVVGARGDDDRYVESGSAYIFDTSTGAQLFKLTASDGWPTRNFGASVAVSGTTVVVGAWGNYDRGSGSAYIFRVDTSNWTQLFKLTPSDGAQFDNFGYSVAVSGTTALVGAPNSQSAYIFNTINGFQLFKLSASDGAAGDQFGNSVAVSGSTGVVGAFLHGDRGVNSGSAYIFDTTTGAQLLKLTASDGNTYDYLGRSVAVRDTMAFVGANGDHSGSLYIFSSTPGPSPSPSPSPAPTLSPFHRIKLTASDNSAGNNFGISVAMSGTTVVVGCPEGEGRATDSGSVYIFDTSTGAQLRKLTASDGDISHYFGFSVAVIDTVVVIGAHGDDDRGSSSGSVYIFETSNGTQLFKLTASDGAGGDSFGYSVTVIDTAVVVGAYGDQDRGISSGSVYIFDTSTGAQLFKLTASDGADYDYFGWSVAVSDTRAVVGAHSDDDRGNNSGSAYVFSASTGVQLLKLTASDGSVGDSFGYSVSINGATAVVGARFDDDRFGESGSAYIFDTSTGAQLFKLTASDGYGGDYFGWSVAVSGTMAVIGAYGDDDRGSVSGSAYIFDSNTGAQLFKLTASDGAANDYFGYSVAVSGATAVVGGYRNDDRGSAYIF